ncbi:hypothetical protein GCM10020358_21440 [Amorphoplanes nipponensis]|uniref:hypothetical protein n=1 Tax=Actinoplanes nipponensis TaxID=135950 RepID=UPI0031E773D1
MEVAYEGSRLKIDVRTRQSKNKTGASGGGKSPEARGGISPEKKPGMEGRPEMQETRNRQVAQKQIIEGVEGVTKKADKAKERTQNRVIPRKGEQTNHKTKPACKHA